MYSNQLPLAGLKVINYPSKIKLQVEKRKVKLDDNVLPVQDNAWIYKSVFFPMQPGSAVRSNYLGPIINVERGTPCEVSWINKLKGMNGMSAMQELPPINPPVMAANDPNDPNMKCAKPTMQPSVGIVTHVHGLKVAHVFDGWPLEPVGYLDNPYHFPSIRKYTYPNDQRAAMLWFHDHAMDNTAPQVHAGLAGLYFIRDHSDEEILNLIGGARQEIPLVIQDRNLGDDYQRIDYAAGLPDNGDNSRPEFLGQTIFVNGRASPFHAVERSIYRLRIINGSNARTYALALMNPNAEKMPNARVWYSDCMRVIGADGGLLTQSVTLKKVAENQSGTDFLLIAPGERFDVLLDLTAAELNEISCLNLVNLAVTSAIAKEVPEAIFRSTGLSVQHPQNNTDASLIEALKTPQANIMQFCIGQQPASPTLNIGVLNNILRAHADDENFILNNGRLGTNPPNAPIVRNRFVLLMNNSSKNNGDNPLTPWQDVQMWELGQPNPDVVPEWPIPFDVDTDGINPLPGHSINDQKTYGIYRATFFQEFHAPLIDAHGYPSVHAPTFTPKAGTYERWYVANIGNKQINNNDDVDMHPFHLHLANFVVQRRWTLIHDRFEESQQVNKLELDGVARHDTVRVQSKELLELLVYFPPGYVGDYVYHCHLVEHEDMGMMLHFSVQP